jgi:exopolyphosphatase/pppGpp-phosphohydrolase
VKITVSPDSTVRAGLAVVEAVMTVLVGQEVDFSDVGAAGTRCHAALLP